MAAEKLVGMGIRHQKPPLRSNGHRLPCAGALARACARPKLTFLSATRSLLTCCSLPALTCHARCVKRIALARKGGDNITVVIVRLFSPRPEQQVALKFQKPGSKRRVATGGPNSFLQLKTKESFVRVVGGF